MTFDKNFVIADSAFKIHFEEQAAPMVACHRCGHLNEKRLRTVCKHCYRFIAPGEPRQNWKRKTILLNEYKELGELLYQERPLASELSFEKVRRSYAARRQVRRAAILAACSFAFVFASTFAFKTLVDHQTYARFESSINHAVTTTCHTLRALS